MGKNLILLKSKLSKKTTGWDYTKAKVLKIKPMMSFSKINKTKEKGKLKTWKMICPLCGKEYSEKFIGIPIRKDFLGIKGEVEISGYGESDGRLMLHCKNHTIYD